MPPDLVQGMNPVDPPAASVLLAEWGFLSRPDLPDQPGPAYLLAALRPTPTLRHFDPEAIEYWVSRDGKGVRRTLSRAIAMPFETDFAWGTIRVIDRLAISNEYLTFGGHLSAEAVDGFVVAVFCSDAPLPRRGGHSQRWDAGADNLAAFFARLTLAIDCVPGLEERVAAATPATRYGAFVRDQVARYRRSPTLRATDQDFANLMQAEEHRLQRQLPVDWAAGGDLLAVAGIGGPTL